MSGVVAVERYSIRIVLVDDGEIEIIAMCVFNPFTKERYGNF